MTPTRIFVSYCTEDTSHAAIKIATQLVADLRAAGAEVVTDSDTIPNDAFIPFLNQQLAQCQWLILLQTPAALRSLRVQAAVTTTLNQIGQKQMQGVMRVIATPTEDADEPLMWATTHVFDASEDYPRARDKMLLELNLITVDDGPEDSFVTIQAPLSLPIAKINSSALTSADKPAQLNSASVFVSKRGTLQQQGKIDRPSHPPATQRRHLLWTPLLILIIVFTVGIATTITLIGRSFANSRHTTNITAMPVPRHVATSAVGATAKSTPTTGVTATPTRAPMPTPQSRYASATSRQPFFNDPLSMQDTNQWSEVQGNMGRCAFINGAYHASASSPHHYARCIANAAQNQNLQNFAFQVQMTMNQGDAGGLIFRTNQDHTMFYAFTICLNPSCHQGNYGLHVLAPHDTRLAMGFSAAINSQSNLLTVIARGSNIYLYINKQLVTSISDATLSLGAIGVTAYEGQHTTEVTFSNAQVWQL